MGASNILLSFIIPFFNGERTIGNCLESIFKINAEDCAYEVIVVDDCSPIPAVQVIGSYLNSHPNLRIIRNTINKKQGGAKNTGILNANGYYIAFADQDDVIFHGNIPEIIQNGINLRADIISCNWVEAEGSIKRTCGLQFTKITNMSGKEFCETCYDASKSLAPWSYYYKRNFLLDQKHPMEENVLSEDSDWIAWHLFHARLISIFPSCIYQWNIINNSVSHNNNYKTKADYIKFGLRKILASQILFEESPIFSERLRNDGLYNINHTFEKLWKVDSYKMFYKHLGKDMLVVLLNLPLSRIARFEVKHENITCCALTVIGPLLKTLLSVKNSFYA